MHLDIPEDTRKVMQRLLNEAYALIIKQGGPSSVLEKGDAEDDDPYKCKYSYKGLHCNFWPAIKTYHQRMERKTSKWILDNLTSCLHRDVAEQATSPDFRRFVLDLQRAHDWCPRGDSFLHQYKIAMNLLARNYCLVSPISTDNLEV